MSKRKPTRSTAPQEELHPSSVVAPLKPRKGWFVVLCVAFAVWVGFLTTLYFTTVYGKVDPHAHQLADEAPKRP